VLHEDGRNGNARAVLRHRGKSPRQAAFFFRSPELKFHAANLASLFVLYGLLRATSRGVESSYRVGSLESGALLCGGYEAYRELHSPAAISFEHAWQRAERLLTRTQIAGSPGSLTARGCRLSGSQDSWHSRQ